MELFGAKTISSRDKIEFFSDDRGACRTARPSQLENNATAGSIRDDIKGHGRPLGVHSRNFSKRSQRKVN